jgi:hypothetical protein
MFLHVFAPIPLGDQFADDLFKFLFTDGTLHDKVHLVEGLHQCLVIFPLLKLLIEVELEREVLLNVLGNLCA